MASLFKVVSLAAALSQTFALDLDTSSSDSIKKAASIIASDLVSLYPTNTTSNDSIGIFSGQYYWWESGAAWASLVDYYAYTNDSRYNSLVAQALSAQKGPYNDFMPPAQTKGEGNDDQTTWALACMDAAENGVPQSAGSPSWLELATNVWNDQAARWDNSSCGGGLRWQIYSFNAGYNYKNSASNGQFFQLSARLAKMTGNSTYSQWADMSYNWLSSIGLIDGQGNVFDGTDASTNCSQINNIRWSYDAASIILGSSALYNTTNGSSLWKDRVAILLNATIQTFTSNSSHVLTESACEGPGSCSNDQIAFKGIAARWLAKASVLSPFIHDQVSTILTASANAAAKTCDGTGGGNNSICTTVSWVDGSAASQSNQNGNLGQELNALSVIQSLLLIDGYAAPGNTSTTTTTGSSQPSSSTASSSTPSSSTTLSNAATRCNSGHITILSALILLVVGQCLLSL